jgi:hypothetical protein
MAKKFGNDDLKKKGLDSKIDGSNYELWEKGKTKSSKKNTKGSKK